eukprot:144046-Rhodomonas_salina.1
MQTQTAPCRRMVCLSLFPRAMKHLHPYKLVQEQSHAQRLRGGSGKRPTEEQTEPERKRPALQSGRANATCILQEMIGPCEVVVPQSSSRNLLVESEGPSMSNLSEQLALVQAAKTTNLEGSRRH